MKSWFWIIEKWKQNDKRMTTIKSFTSLEQSRKLADILPLESADMYYFLDPTPAGNIYHLVVQRVDVGIKNLPEYDKGDIPAWSLSALLSVIPQVKLDSIKQYDKKYWRCCAYFASDWHNSDWCDNPVDACYSMIIKLHELKML